jgi:acylphosphatase
VQGVGFRAHAAARAQHLGLAGFVRNRADGAVAGEAQGPPEALAAFAQWLHRGSPLARVDHVDFADLPMVPAESAFVVRR